MINRVRYIVPLAVMFALTFVASRPVSAEESPVSTLQAQAVGEAIRLAMADASTNAPFIAPAFAVLNEGENSSAAQPGQQSSRHGGIGVGFKIGPLWPTFDQANVTFDNKVGYLLGIFLGGNRPGIVGVMTEIMYAKKKFTQSGLTAETTLNYLEIPILLRINAGSSSLNRILGYGLVGPVFDIRLKATDQNGLDIKDRFESYDIGIIAGGGIEITRFIIEARGNWGLRNIRGANVLDAEEIKTHSFVLLFGVRFN